MDVHVAAIGLVISDQPGTVEGFNPRKELPNRKHLKLMSRADRLGVAAVGRAIQSFEGWDQIAPERRGLFVGCMPEGTDPDDLLPAIERSCVDGAFSVSVFGAEGLPRVHPLWLVRGLSNNVLGFACAYWDIRGVNGNRCEGRVGGLAAIVEGARAVAEGRVDVAVAGGTDSLVKASDLLPYPVGEGAAFLVLVPGDSKPPRIADGGLSFGSAGELAEFGPLGDLGAASGAVELARKLQDGALGFRVEVRDPAGLCAWAEITG